MLGLSFGEILVIFFVFLVLKPREFVRLSSYLRRLKSGFNDEVKSQVFEVFDYTLPETKSLPSETISNK